MAQIKLALEEFNGLTDATDKEVAANQINYRWKRLITGEEDLKTATDKLAEILGEADPTIMEERPTNRLTKMKVTEMKFC